ncbi:MAG: hypothetical protein IT384_17470 [Deltaproteobacteria bacterium]|nr:hypothetical protein [Deltaproteobacteria bacterium]
MSATLALLLAACAVGAPSPLSTGPGWMLGLDFQRTHGERPSHVPKAGSFEQLEGWAYVRAGITADRPGTELGAQLGFEFAGALGFAKNETGETEDRTGLGVMLRPSLAIRALTFNVPIEGQLAFHLGPELNAGGARWWSDDARLALVGGSRIAVSIDERVWFELEYQLVPYLVTGAPGALHVGRFEHRLQLTVAAWRVGATLGLMIGDNRTRLEDGPVEASRSVRIGFGIEWRGESE